MWSSIVPFKETILSRRSREYMSKDRSPRTVLSITIGTSCALVSGRVLKTLCKVCRCRGRLPKDRNHDMQRGCPRETRRCHLLTPKRSVFGIGVVATLVERRKWPKAQQSEVLIDHCARLKLLINALTKLDLSPFAADSLGNFRSGFASLFAR